MICSDGSGCGVLVYQLIDPDLGPVFTKEPLDDTDLTCSFYFPGLDLLTANKFNPDQPRDSKGRWMPAGMAKGTGRTPSAAGQSAMVHAALGKKADVSSHIEAINTLRSRGTDLSKEEITAHVNRLGRHLNKAQVHDVARATGVAVAKTKKDTLAAIHEHLTGQTPAAAGHTGTTPVAQTGKATLKHEIVKVAPIDSWSGARWKVGDKEFLSAKDAKAHVTSLKSTADDARGIAQKSREFASQIGRDQQKRGDPLWDGRARDAVTHAERLESLAKATAGAKTTQDVQRIRDAVDGPLRHMVGKGSPADQKQIDLVAKLTGIHQHLQDSSKGQAAAEGAARVAAVARERYYQEPVTTIHDLRTRLESLKDDVQFGRLTAAQGKEIHERLKAIGGHLASAPGGQAGKGATSSDFATKVVEAAKGLPNTFGHARDPGSEKWMGHKVYVSDLYDHLKPTLGGMGLKDFKQKLLEAHLGGKLTLLRDDIAGTRSHEAGAKHGASEIQHLNATFHTVDAHGKSTAATAPAQPEPHQALAAAVAGKQGFTGPFQRGPHTVVRHDDSGHTIEAEAGSHSGRFAVKDPSNVVHSRHDTAEAAVAAIHGVNRIGTSQGTVDKELRDRAAQTGKGALDVPNTYRAEKPTAEQAKRPSREYRQQAIEAVAREETKVRDLYDQLKGQNFYGIASSGKHPGDIGTHYRGRIEGLRSSGAPHPTPTVGDVDRHVRDAITDLRKRADELNRIAGRARSSK